MSDSQSSTLATSPLPLSAGFEEKRAQAPGSGSGGEKDKEKEKGLMLPPPIPIKEREGGAPAPPRMTRLPSLKQLSDHLHYTPSSASSATLPNPLTTPGASPSSIPATPPSLRIATGSLASSTPGGLNQSPLIAPSPSSRLRLPASAMMRSLSSGSNAGGSIIGTPLETGHSPQWTSRGFSSGSGPGSGSGDLFSASGSTKDTTVDSPVPQTAATVTAMTITGVPGPVPAPLPGREGAPVMSRTNSSNSYIQGYNNVPSLDQIRRRVSISLARTASASATPTLASVASPIATATATDSPVGARAEGTTKDASPSTTKEVDVASPPETASVASSSGDEKQGKKKEHPLRHAWTLFFDSKTYKPDTSAMQKKEGGSALSEYEMSLLTVGKFDTVEGFARHLNNIRLPSLLNKNSNYHMFKNGIRPMWEDPANANGGKWVILFRNSSPTMDVAWANLTMALVGEILDPEDLVCGVVASNRPKIDRIQIWTRSRDDVEKMNKLGRKIVEVMGLEGRDAECMSMEFQYNASNSNPPPNRFIHIPFSNARPTPSSTPNRLSASHSFNGPVGLGIGMTASSTSRSSSPNPGGTGVAFPARSPTNTTFGGHGNNASAGGMLEPPQFRARLGSGSGSNAFAGPMGGMGIGMARVGSNGGSGGGGIGGGSASASASPSPSVSPSPTPRPMRA
ncbi:hypothetical protein I317_05611 [Kwoniella heveanensis CBS 569]|nr:hypothetical protein I317_05611 [Kwoniella heveanensis CBS 569]